MSNAIPPVIDGSQAQPKRRRLWLWFLTGFVAVFLGLAIGYPMHFYDGRSLRRTVLWEYYLLEIRLASTSSGALGPTSGNAGAAFTTAASHAVISGIGGALVMAIGWATQRRSNVA